MEAAFAFRTRLIGFYKIFTLRKVTLGEQETEGVAYFRNVRG